MVNYCCVYGCGRNSKSSNHLFYYSVPKDNPRQEQWLRAIGREDLLEKNLKRSYRVCSRHFAPSSLKNKHLCADAVPTLCLTGDNFQVPYEIPEKPDKTHHVACNSCEKVIVGYRYKCITCVDYDLCSKCEIFEAHSDHYMLRLPKPVDFKVADDLIKKWQQFVNTEHIKVESHSPLSDTSSDDDLPITSYVKQNDSGIDLPDDIKVKISNEVARVLSIKCIESKKRKKKETRRNDDCKKKKIVKTEDKSCGTEDLEALFPDVVFADVNDIASDQLIHVKSELATDFAPTIEAPQPITDINFSDSDFMLTTLS